MPRRPTVRNSIFSYHIVALQPDSEQGTLHWRYMSEQRKKSVMMALDFINNPTKKAPAECENLSSQFFHLLGLCRCKHHKSHLYKSLLIHHSLNH